MPPLISLLRSYASIMYQRKVCHKNTFCCRMDRNLHQKSWFCVSGEVYEVFGRVIHCDVSSWRSDLEVFFLGFLYGLVFLKKLRTIRVLKYEKLVENNFLLFFLQKLGKNIEIRIKCCFGHFGANFGQNGPFWPFVGSRFFSIFYG